jgi:NADH-quinone oxidoreductase subunit H
MSARDLLLMLIPAAIKAALAGFMIIPLVAGYAVLAERKILGFVQVRPGPNRVGLGKFHLWGLLQPIADALKLMVKEDITPTRVQKIVYLIAPAIVIAPALMIFAVIPWSWNDAAAKTIFDEFQIGTGSASVFFTPITDVNVALLLILSISSVGVYGIILGGWSSNNKYSLMGGLRSAAQMVSYEVPMGLAIATCLILAKSFQMSDIVVGQMQNHIWFVFPALAAFVIYLISGVAETNRCPFDLPEAENELVAGFNTEYSGFSFACFFVAEYANIFVVSSVAITLFLGGWLPIFPSVKAMWLIPPIVWFSAKLATFVFCFIWIRATLPRFRFDQLMGLSWKRLIPIALLNLLVTSAAVLIPGNIGRWPTGWALLSALNLVLLATAAFRVFKPAPAAASRA